MKTLKLLLATLSLLLPATATAHVHLASSSPAKGDTVRTALSEIRLHFTEAVVDRYTIVVLLDATGHELTFGTLQPVGGSPSKEYVLKLDRPLMSGEFTVKWKAAGDDGHANNGLFEFVVDVPAPVKPPAPIVAPTTPSHQTSSTEIAPRFRPDSRGWVFARALNFMALLLLVGSVVFRLGVLERARRAFSDADLNKIDKNVRVIASVAISFGIISCMDRLFLQSGMLNGEARLWDGAALKALVLHTGWGKAWLAEFIALLGAFFSLALSRKGPAESWQPTALFAVAAACTPAFSGHAAAVQQMAIVPVLDDALHVMSASAWLGSLAVMLIAALPVAVRSEDGFSKAATLVNTFSPLALVMAGIAVFTGAMNAFVHITAFSDFWTTSYGKVLAIKIGVVLITASTGAYNWKVVRPRLGTEGATSHIKKSATAEVTVAAVVILITAVLVGTPTP